MRCTASARTACGRVGFWLISHRYLPSRVDRISQPSAGLCSSTQYSCETIPPKKLILNLALVAVSATLAFAFHSETGPSGAPLWQACSTAKVSPLRTQSDVPAWQPFWVLLGRRATSYQRPII